MGGGRDRIRRRLPLRTRRVLRKETWGDEYGALWCALVRSLPGTWRDLGGDYEYDDGPEKKEPLDFVAATTVAVGTALASSARAAPRTDPSVHN